MISEHICIFCKNLMKGDDYYSTCHCKAGYVLFDDKRNAYTYLIYKFDSMFLIEHRALINKTFISFDLISFEIDGYDENIINNKIEEMLLFK